LRHDQPSRLVGTFLIEGYCFPDELGLFRAPFMQGDAALAVNDCQPGGGEILDALGDNGVTYSKRGNKFAGGETGFGVGGKILQDFERPDRSEAVSDEGF